MDSSFQEDMAIFYNIFSAVHYVNTICKVFSQGRLCINGFKSNLMAGNLNSHALKYMPSTANGRRWMVSIKYYTSNLALSIK